MKTDSRREKTEARFLMITCALVTLIGLPAFFSLFRESQVVQASEIKKSNDRSPASISPAAIAATFEKPTVETIKINCAQPVEKIETSAHQIRLITVNCKNKMDLTSVTNQSNGFTASIFKSVEGLSTDFIDLNEGVNLFVLSTAAESDKHADKNDKNKEKTITVHRRMPASVENKK